MKIYLFSHPAFLKSNSMPRFANMIEKGLVSRGHDVIAMSARPFVSKINIPKISKWLGYFDQYVLYSIYIFFRSIFFSKNDIVVFSDQALGIWIPFVVRGVKIVHVHDFMAAKSARGLYPQNRTALSGRIYQKLIQLGFSSASNFICVSEQTKNDLAKFLKSDENKRKFVVYNGLNYDFRRIDYSDCWNELDSIFLESATLKNGFVLHVGGDQWYKNRIGVLEIYEKYSLSTQNPLPLLLVGPKLNDDQSRILKRLPNSAQVLIISNISAAQLRAIYSLSSVLLFPSYAEGFGWPIIEAMACGCPVITTNDAPMTEVGINAATYIDVRPLDSSSHWAMKSAAVLAAVIAEDSIQRESRREKSAQNVRRFIENDAITLYEEVYKKCRGVDL